MKNIFIVIIVLAFTTCGHCAEKIGGIMGLTLGHKFFPPSAKSGCKLLEKRNDKWESCAVFIYELPQNQIYRMNTVEVSVTPKTGIICAIAARTRTNEFTSLEAATNTLNLIVSRLEEKHGKATDNYIERGGQRVGWVVHKKWGERINSKGEKEEVVTNAMIYINCFDRELTNKASEEREELNGESAIFESF